MSRVKIIRIMPSTSQWCLYESDFAYKHNGGGLFVVEKSRTLLNDGKSYTRDEMAKIIREHRKGHL